MVWGIAFGELLCGDLWGVFCGYAGMRTHFLSINPSYPIGTRTPWVYPRKIGAWELFWLGFRLL